MSPEERQIALGARAALEALDWLGTPYRHQASQKGQGTDCLGLVRGVYRAVVAREDEVPPPYPRRLRPGSEPLLEAAARHLTPATELRQGTVILFRMRRTLPVGHCAIALSSDGFIHAYEGQSVVTSSLSPFWRERIASLFQFPDLS